MNTLILFKILLAPLLGCVIGYITNDLAIKMLFRPRKSIYIGKWHIPFTPGLIPQQKNRIAASIGKVISAQLLNSETIKQTILSEKTLLIIKDKIQSSLKQYKNDARTLNQVLEEYIEPEKIEAYKVSIQKQGTQFLIEKMEAEQVGTKIVQSGISALRKKMQGKMIENLIDEGYFKNIENALGKIVDDTLYEQAPQMIQEEIEKTEDNLLGMTLGEIYEQQQEHISAATEKIVDIYRIVVDDNLAQILKVINIEDIVVEKVSSFDAIQLEEMIFGIMKKELKAIVYLGALLGFLMGFINLLL